MKFNVILADPPWTYRTWSAKGAGRTASSHYPVLDIEEIKRLPVADIAADDCALFLWATYPNLLEAIDTISSWSFTFKTVAFTWVKRNSTAGNIRELVSEASMDLERGRTAGVLSAIKRIHSSAGWFWGLGHWTRANPEVLLLATKGHPKRVDKGVHAVIEAPVMRHSAKPPETRLLIERLMGDLPRVELFARESAPGWTALGNEIDGADIRDALPALAGKGRAHYPLPGSPAPILNHLDLFDAEETAA